MHKNGSYLYLPLPSLIIISIFLQVLFFSRPVNALNSKYFYCNSKIYIDIHMISMQEINSICDWISEDDRFIIFVSSNISFNDDYSYLQYSDQFFQSQCVYNTIKCEYNLGISIFTNTNKIVLSTGKVSKNQVTSQQQNYLTNQMVSELNQNNNIYATVILGISSLQKLAPNDGINNASNYGIFSILLFIICPVLCCVVIFMKFKESQDNSKVFTDDEDYNPKVSHTGNTLSNNIITQGDIPISEEIHKHWLQLEEWIKQIRKTSPPIISTNKCLICMEKIVIPWNSVSNRNSTQNSNYIEMQKLSNEQPPVHNTPPNPTILNLNSGCYANDTLNTRFACQHIYHIDCWSSNNITSCIMCIDTKGSQEIIPNTWDTQVIDEGHIKNFIQNLNSIYKQKELSDYYSNYPGEFDTFNTTLMLGLAAAWGISAMNGPNVYINNYNYNYIGGNEIYGQNPITYENQNIGMYEPPNWSWVNNNNPGSFSGKYINVGDYKIDDVIMNQGSYGGINQNEGDFGGDDDYYN